MTTLSKAPISARRTVLPPGPKGAWPFGILDAFRRDSLGVIMSTTRQYGDVALLSFGPTRVFLINHPDLIKHVLQDNHRNYLKDPFTMNIIREFNGENVFTSDGEFWLQQRRTLQPAFHRQRLAGFARAMVASAEQMLEEWAAAPADGYVDVEHAMMRVTLRIVGHTLFSVDLLADGDALGRAFNVADRYLQYRLDHPFYLPRWVPTRLNRETTWAMRFSRERLLGMIAERRRADPKDDLLSMLIEARDEETGLGMDDEQIRREVTVMVAAGHETTADTLTWVFYALDQNRAVEARLHAELAEVLNGRAPTMEDLPRLPYTRAVIDEALRLYPPAWATSRMAAGPDDLGGYAVAPKEVVMLAPYAIQRDPRFWEAPEVFQPERFLAGAGDRPKFAYLPFGGGPRLCIGQNFALTEAALVLAMVAQRYAPRLKPGHPVAPKPMFTLKTSHGLPMRLERR